MLSYYYMLKYSRAIRCVYFELKTNVSELSSISIIRVDMVNDHMSLIYIPVCQINASTYLCTMQQEDRVKLCDHPSNSNLSLFRLTWCPCCQLFCFLCSMLYSVSSWDFLFLFCAGQFTWLTCFISLRIVQWIFFSRLDIPVHPITVSDYPFRPVFLNLCETANRYIFFFIKRGPVRHKFTRKYLFNFI
jgi:hypothetical protein